MDKIVGYSILTETNDPYALQKLVEIKLKQGWELYGEISINIYIKDGLVIVRYTQVVVRREDLVIPPEIPI